MITAGLVLALVLLGVGVFFWGAVTICPRKATQKVDGLDEFVIRGFCASLSLAHAAALAAVLAAACIVNSN